MLKRTLLIVLTFTFTCVSNAGAQSTLIVEPGGANLRAAFDKVENDPAITEIILTDGLYEGHFRIEAPKNHEGELPRLTIRAAEGATPLIRNSKQITKAEAIDEAIGYYRIKLLPPSDPQMWERDTRTRYITLSNAASVAAYPGSCFDDRKEGYLYFRTSDGKAPASHKLWLAMCAKNSRGFFLRRANTTIEGLHFADYVNLNGIAIQSFDKNTIIRNCRFDNCETAWGLTPGSDDGLIENCVGIDVARGVYSNANNITIRNNRFIKTRDAFLYPLYPQNDTAYQVYHPGTGGIIEGNLAKGYLEAIFIKAREAPYIIRHNTVIDSHIAIGFSSGLKKACIVSHNIVVDARSLLMLTGFHADSIVENNILWQPREIGAFHESMNVIRGANVGQNTVLADPMFVNAAAGDYRVLPQSLAVALADESGRPVGAYGVATVGDAKNARPTLEIAFLADSKPYGSNGDYTFARDPWIGGGTTHIKELYHQGKIQRLTGNTTIDLQPRAIDLTGQITKLRITINDAEPLIVDYDDKYRLQLPDVEGEHQVTFAVQNDRGLWSDSVDTTLRIDRTAPQLAAVPQITANAHGFVMHARTDEACFAELHYGSSPDALNHKVKAPPRVDRKWDSNDGGEWIETWRDPTRDHIIGVLQPDAANSTIYAKLTFADQAGLRSESDVMSVQLTGGARTYEVTHGGLDLQTAIDLGLPGDRITIAPGVYTDDVYIKRGGVEGAPITIEAQQPGTVTLEGAKRCNSLIRVDAAPYVTLRGLRILYFNVAGINAHRSPHLTVDQCSFYNGPGWATGQHVFAFYSPHTTITNCLAVGAEVGFYLLKSPYATLLHNTASQHMYAAAGYPYSLEGTTQMYNSFCYAGNDAFHAEIAHPDELKTFRSDYNNFGTSILGYHRSLQSENPELYELVKAEAFTPPTYDTYIRTGSKAIVGISGERYMTMKQWREVSGQDQHTIFADPGYIRPFVPIDHWDWRVHADSPNLSIRSSDGKPIGAFGVAE